MSPVTVRTEDLSRKASISEEQATRFESLFLEHWPRVYAVLFRLVGDPAEAEDLALEAFLRLYHRLPTGADNPGGWLYRVATNLGFNALRARSRRVQYEEQAGRLALEAGAPLDPAGEAERAEERRQVQAVLGKMKPRSARLLILRHSGLSYAEIAAALDLAPGSIGALLARAAAEFEDRYRKLVGD